MKNASHRIAIVGMGCRFGGANDLQAYWRLLLEGRDAFAPVPEDRWPNDAFFDTSRRATDKSYAPHGAWIDDIRSFPALALGLPPRRVEVMDPQQRFAIEVSLQAIEDAGYQPAELPRRTGVFLGITATEYRVLQSARVLAQYMAAGTFGQPPEDAAALAAAVERIVPSRPYTAPGTLGNMSAAAVAQELDLHGPAFTTDAACASAHMAISDAVLRLRQGELDAAIAGGSYVCITPEHHIAFSRIGAMSASGYCLPFDDRADGFVQGDGAGVVLLKRLDDALRDGDRVYAVIEGVALNNDGRGDGPMAPSIDGQREVIEAAWADAGLDPAALGYVEAHGTGTSVGDITEFQGLMSSLGDRVERAAIGSSKANVGHTMSAAGIAGLIRAALAVYHRTVPPMANFENPKPDLELDASPFEIPTQPLPWDRDDRIAAISSFGFGGTNGHLVIQSAAEPAPAPEAPELILLSAPDEDSLKQLAADTAAALRAATSTALGDVARTLARRDAQPARLAIVATSVDELTTKLEAFADGEPPRGVRSGVAPEEPPTIAFLFPGQGSQRIGMLSGIRDRFPVVAETLDAIEAKVDGLPVPLTHLLYPERRTTPVDEETALAELTDTASCQPVLLAAGIALHRLLEQVNIRPAVVVGHSLGEFTAAAAAGVLTPADAADFVARRGRAMSEISGDTGAMAAVMADLPTVESLLVDGAVIANHNHPRQIVISGSTEAVDAVVAAAHAAEVKAKRLQVSHGFHSPIFADLDIEALLSGLSVNEPALPVASGIADHPYRDAEDARAVFTRHAVSPVRFVDALHQCRDAGADLYLQIGAGGPLASFARGSLPRDHRGVLSLASINDAEGSTSLLETLGQLWLLGADLDLDPIICGTSLASLPPRVLPRESYWAVKDEAQLKLDVSGASAAASRRSPSTAADTPTEPDTQAAQGDDTTDRVIGVISKVSAYPRSALKVSMTLVDDLGFDSLMVGDLATGLAEAFPGLPGIPQELLINGPTVQDIVDFVQSAGRSSASTEDDDAPLLGWEPTWVQAALPDLPATPHTAGSVLLVGSGTEVDRLAASLSEAGHSVSRSTSDEAPSASAADWLVWCALDETPSIGAVLAGESDWTDLAGPFLATAAAHAGTGPRLTVVARTDNPWAAALMGAVRALDAEWSSRCKLLSVDTTDALGDRILAEQTTADTTPVIRYLAGQRYVTGLAPTTAESETLGADDTVLITGGTRGIGAKLAARVLETGARALLVGRSAPSEEATALIADSGGRAVHVQCDVTDRDALIAATRDLGPITAIVHAAGVLADGPVADVSADRGQTARAVKALGWLNAIVAAGPTLRMALSIGSWAGRFGNRHQAHYAAANALLAELAVETAPFARAVCAEMGPWTSSEMVQTIPAAIQAAMRAEGVDFVGDTAGLDALWSDLTGARGIVVHGRRLGHTVRSLVWEETLSVETHPYLLDHAVAGVPVLPLAGASDLMAWTACAELPYTLSDVTLYQGVAVREPTRIRCIARGERVEIRVGPKAALAYRARVRPLADQPELPPIAEGGDAPSLSLSDFYENVTFHGPLLQGITALDGVGTDFVRGRVRTGSPVEWIPGATRPRWTIDPLALDSAMQLSAYVAWNRYQRGGTPVGLDQWTQLRPLPEGEIVAEVRFGEAEGDRFSGDIVLRDTSGQVLAIATGVVAELRQVEETGEDDDAPFEVPAEWIDPSTWSAVKDLEQRLQMAALAGIENPYFTVHEGTAANTTVVGGRELVNYSSYNYLGLSGDPRVVEQVLHACQTYGTSVSASRVASGERPFHTELERELAAAQGTEDALVFTAGHATNVTTIGHLLGPDDLILHDELIHDSALQGIKLSGSSRRAFRHDDPEHLEAQLRDLRRHYQKVLIVVEGVYSMDGDICDLPSYIELKKKYGCMLMVDEAHSFGVVGATGQGVREHFDIDGRDVDIWMGTLSKSLASCGGWISARAPLIKYLRYTAPGFVYSAGITPANGVAALASLRLMIEEYERVQTLQGNALVFHDALTERGMDTGPARGESAVVPVITGNSFHALQLSQRLLRAGINVQPIVYPAVADDAARLRFFLSSTHTHEQLRWTAEKVADILGEVRAEFPAS